MNKTTNTKTAVFAGSFDPITLGHLSVLEEGSKIFDKIIIAVAKNSEKTSMFSAETRIEMIKLSVKRFPNIVVDSFEGLTVDYAKKSGAVALLRGLRNSSDFEYESQLAQNNHSLCENIPTVFILTKPEYSFISSSAVREIIKNNGDISKLVPKEIFDFINNGSQSVHY